MEPSFSTYVGIDVQAIQKPFYYTALNSSLETIACGHGRISDVLAYLAGQSSALVAINGPVWAPEYESVFSQGGLFGENETSFADTQRDVDIEMTVRGYSVTSVPPIGKKCPAWMERSLEMTYAIKRLGYRNYGETQSQRIFFETNTDAAYQRITGSAPYDSRSLEGRMQFQLLLFEFGFSVQNPMAFLEEFTRFRLRTSNVPLEQIGVAHELRAMMTAATAWLLDNHPDQMEQLGKTRQGNVFLPADFSR